MPDEGEPSATQRATELAHRVALVRVDEVADLRVSIDVRTLDITAVTTETAGMNIEVARLTYAVPAEETTKQAAEITKQVEVKEKSRTRRKLIEAGLAVALIGGMALVDDSSVRFFFGLALSALFGVEIYERARGGASNRTG